MQDTPGIIEELVEIAKLVDRADELTASVLAMLIERHLSRIAMYDSMADFAQAQRQIVRDRAARSGS